MSANDNTKTIQRVYEAFGRGDIPTVLDAVTDDADSATEAGGTDAPWWGPHAGRAGVHEFFEQFAAAMEVDEFTPLVIAADGDAVLSVVRLRVRSRATGTAGTGRSWRPKRRTDSSSATGWPAQTVRQIPTCRWPGRVSRSRRSTSGVRVRSRVASQAPRPWSGS